MSISSSHVGVNEEEKGGGLEGMLILMIVINAIES